MSPDPCGSMSILWAGLMVTSALWGISSAIDRMAKVMEKAYADRNR